ncbi:MAG: metalloregulator ArsR/SmtB family transcription factor [Pseudolysinimonas sp.]
MHEFELLADPTRRRIVEHLARQELSVVVLTARLAEVAPVSRSAVSHQLAVLRRAEFVEVRDWGPERRYRLAWNAMDRLDAAVERLWMIWEDRVGWPYETVREPPERLHRAGRGVLRDRTRAEIEPRDRDDDWFRYLPD